MKLSGKKILLVEDDNFIGDMFIRKLLSEGAICTRAFNGNDGLMKLSENKNNFDLIVTDVMMAEMDGYEMVKQIKEQEIAKNIPVVVLTNRTSLTVENSKISDLDIAAFYVKSDSALSVLVDDFVEIIKKNEQTNLG